MYCVQHGIIYFDIFYYTNTQVLDYTMQVSADTLQVCAGTMQVRADTTQVRADTMQVRAGTMQVRADTTQVHADTMQVRADTTQVRADTTQVRTDTPYSIPPSHSVLLRKTTTAVTVSFFWKGVERVRFTRTSCEYERNKLRPLDLCSHWLKVPARQEKAYSWYMPTSCPSISLLRASRIVKPSFNQSRELVFLCRY
jgi:hypothetical protein